MNRKIREEPSIEASAAEVGQQERVTFQVWRHPDRPGEMANRLLIPEGMPKPQALLWLSHALTAYLEELGEDGQFSPPGSS